MKLSTATEFMNEETGDYGTCAGCLLPLIPGEEVCNYKGLGMHVECYECEKEQADEYCAEKIAELRREHFNEGRLKP
jgi:hypothetical protein